MLKRLIKDPLLLTLLLVTLFIKLFSLNAVWVEKYYTYGLYPVIVKTLRLLLGWIPFSIGDIIYAVATVYLLAKIFRLFVLIKKRTTRKTALANALQKLMRLALIVYAVFNLFWGLNYNRLGIARQLNLDVQRYSVTELTRLTNALHQRLNACASQTASGNKKGEEKNRLLFKTGTDAYERAATRYPYLHYPIASIKPSLFSHIGHYFGFTGYYNPFSGEAQIKTTIPDFLKPYVVLHEVAHQVGYAKENEANFVGFLTGREAAHHTMRYSVYFEMYLYARSELSRKDSLANSAFEKTLHPQVKKDMLEFRDYLIKNRNRIEPYISLFYDQFLKWNNQPEGKMTYSEVIAWLIAYEKKYGIENI